MRYATASFSNQPLALFLIPDSSAVAIVPQGSFVPFYDAYMEPPAFFDTDGFTLEGNKYQYNATYRCADHPVVVKWLQQQKLVLGPVVQFEVTTREETNE